MQKDPDHRFQTTRDLAFALESLSSASDSTVAALRAEKPIQPSWIISAFFFLATLVLAAFLFRSSGKSAPQSNPEVRRLSILLPEHSILNTMAISPDGRRLACVVNTPIGLSKLWLRSLDSTKSEEVPGTEDASFPFWSPDSRSIGFFTQDRLKTLTIGAGPAESLYKVDIPKGGAWNQHGEILFAPANGGGLYRIRAGGGEATLVTDPLPDETHRFPNFLPDGRHFFYIIHSPEPDSQGLYIGSLDSKEKKRLFPDATPVDYVEPGYGLFVSNEKLMLQPFDTKRLEFTGEATPIADNVESTWQAGPIFSVSANNVLVYGKTTRWNAQPVWVDRSGKQLSSLGNPGFYQFSDMSSDEKRLLTTYNTRKWMVDLLKGSFVRYAITDDQGFYSTAFSPDGSRVVYAEQETDKIFHRLSNGTGNAELLFDPKVKTDWARNISWSADGKFIIFTRSNPKTKYDLWVVPLFGDREPFPYLETEAAEDNARVSPDGKWIAYESNETGQPEIYVRSFPAIQAGGKWQISTVGAEQPTWRRDGKELFYLTLDKKLMATEVKTGQTIEAGPGRLLFQTHVEPRINTNAMASRRQYFVGSNGQRFLINTIIENTVPVEITVLLNWKSLLKK